MRFDVTQTIAAPVDEVAAAYASAELYETLEGSDKLGPPAVLSREQDGRIVTLRIRYRFTADLSPAVTAVVDPDKLTWVEQSVHDLDARSVAVRLHPDHYADRLRASGTYRYEPEGDATVRRVEGDLKVKALLVAGTVEKAIISGLREHLTQEGRAVEAYLTA
ncbi:DUF2505 family protein [Iamia majanohamensis]|uniref:DUF2505 family protein n=1 Tax=Iamia majanohamensis TaxID=467976 RepID=A0AAF0BQW3_9ACTN|nr:DUF2505 family protein [Iamia majanohamensis]WCO65466.1 DUF2505 family protein [Iamia majanohamensis]